MVVFDAHCDTIIKVLEQDSSLYSNKFQLDISRMKTIGDFIQIFAVFIHPEKYKYSEMRRAIQLIDMIHKQAEVNKEYITLCKNYNDIINTIKENKAAALISIENGGALQGELSALRMFYTLGVRSICLTWNHRNEIADGVGETITQGGLTHFGRSVINEMNRLGMLIDVSHISEKGFWDVIEQTKMPIMASHSNAKAVCRHRRNLTNEQINAIKTNGGVIGINLDTDFLHDSGKASIVDIIRHIDHIASLTGEDHIGLGNDFDGLDNSPEGIAGVEDIAKILDRMISLNYSGSFMDKFAGGNFLRLVKEVIV